MLRAALVLLLVAGCSKDSKDAKETAKPPPATLTTGTVDNTGVRTVKVTMSEKGYAPDRIPGKPGEKLELEFTRTIDASCFEELKTPDGKLVKLPMNTPVTVDVTVPNDGEVKFACGMDMFFGVIVAEKA